MTKAITTDGFEALFRSDTDPWNYAGSPFEAFKRGVLLRACGGRPWARTLELACANGETSRSLAAMTLNLLAIDASPTVIAAARRQVKHPRVTFEVAALPDACPRGPFDLIVASEILYYLPRPDMTVLLDRLAAALAPGGRVVLLHHTIGFDDAAQPPRLAQAAAETHLGRMLEPVLKRQYARFAVAAFIKPGPGSGRLKGMSGG